MSAQCFEITRAMPGHARACRRLCLLHWQPLVSTKRCKKVQECGYAHAAIIASQAEWVTIIATHVVETEGQSITNEDTLHVKKNR